MLARRPLYLQVCDLLIARIAGGEWKPGTNLPNESDLARELGVSAGTTRKALDTLEADRVVVRRQGRGTFVVDQGSREMADRFDRLYEDNGRHLVGDVEVLEQVMQQPTEEEQTRLEVRPQETILRIRRLQTLNGRPFLLEAVCIPISRLPGLEPNAVLDRAIGTLAQGHGVHPARSSERISLAAATCEDAGLLRVEPGKALLKLDRVIVLTDGRPVEWRRGLCNADDIFYLATIG